RVLALIVGGAAAVEPLAVRRQPPRRQTLAPLRFEPADHIAMAIAEHGRRGALFASLSDQHRPAADRVVDDLAGEAEPGEGWRDLVGEIRAQYRQPLLDLAL